MALARLCRRPSLGVSPSFKEIECQQMEQFKKLLTVELTLFNRQTAQWFTRFLSDLGFKSLLNRKQNLYSMAT